MEVHDGIASGEDGLREGRYIQRELLTHWNVAHELQTHCKVAMSLKQSGSFVSGRGEQLEFQILYDC